VAQAQVRVSIGPKVGLNVTSANYKTDDRFATQTALTAEPGFRPGFELGVLACLEWGHWQLQPAVLYSQKGFRLQGTQSHTMSTDGVTPAPYVFTNRLNYVTFPLTVAYTQHLQGQGLHLFAGPYLGVLLGGQYRLTRPSTAYVAESTGAIMAKEYAPDFDPFTDTTLRSQRLDAGFQVGMGYHYKATQLQLGYSMGLRNLAPSDFAQRSAIGNGPHYENWAFQASLAYLFSLSKQR
jgi:hypothetical protein